MTLSRIRASDACGISNGEEYHIGLDVRGTVYPVFDLDRDGMSNVWEVAHRLNHRDPHDAAEEGSAPGAGGNRGENAGGNGDAAETKVTKPESTSSEFKNSDTDKPAVDPVVDKTVRAPLDATESRPAAENDATGKEVRGPRGAVPSSRQE